MSTENEKPKVINLFDHETVHGYRSFELWQGDITNPYEPVDILVFSSTDVDITNLKKDVEGYLQFPPQSVPGALEERYGLKIGQLARDAEYDLLNDLGIWVSKPLEEGIPIRRILCTCFKNNDFIRYKFDISRAINNVFCGIALMEIKAQHEKIKSVALPLLFAGSVGFDKGKVMKYLLPEAKAAIERSANLEKILIYGYAEDDAAVLDKSMNEVLGRTNILSMKKDPIQSPLPVLCEEVCTKIRLSKSLIHKHHRPLVQDLETVLRRDEVRSFELGILGRRLAEMIVNDFYTTKGKEPPSNMLARNVQGLATSNNEFDIPGWIIAYLHVLRSLGNESAHEGPPVQTQGHDGTDYSLALNEQDLVMCLLCIQRVHGFWVAWKEKSIR